MHRIVNRCIINFLLYQKNCIKWRNAMCNQAMSISFLTTPASQDYIICHWYRLSLSVDILLHIKLQLKEFSCDIQRQADNSQRHELGANIAHQYERICIAVICGLWLTAPASRLISSHWLEWLTAQRGRQEPCNIFAISLHVPWGQATQYTCPVHTVQPVPKPRADFWRLRWPDSNDLID